VGEEAAADDEVVGAVELEEERLAGGEGLEGPAAAGLPEVELVEVGAGGEEAVARKRCQVLSVMAR
jgi:hypothetical protein